MLTTTSEPLQGRLNGNEKTPFEATFVSLFSQGEDESLGRVINRTEKPPICYAFLRRRVHEPIV